MHAGLSRANSPQPQPDLGRRLETVVAQYLRRRASSTAFDQSDRLREDGVDVEVVPAWQWAVRAVNRKTEN
jgi:hypothetical protein